MKTLGPFDKIGIQLQNLKFSWSRGFYVDPWVKGFQFPATPILAPKPWHPDGDALWADPLNLVVLSDSDKRTTFLDSVGRLVFSTGNVIPAPDGVTPGIRINLVGPDDPIYKLWDIPGPGNVWVHNRKYSTLPPELKGYVLRVPNDVIAQGYPMNGYSDAKVHLIDFHLGHLVEMQFAEDFPGGGMACHNIAVAQLDDPSTDVSGASAADLSLIDSVLRYDDLMSGWRQRTACALAFAGAAAGDFIPPARMTDARGTDPRAVPYGHHLVIKPDVAARLKSGGPQLTAVVECLEMGMTIVDHGINHSVELEPDARWSQTQLLPLRQLKMNDFHICRA